MDRSPLPPVPPGASALPAFQALEAWVEERRGVGRRQATVALEAARVEAERMRAEGESKLRDVLLAAEREASRTAEDHARDRVSAARVAWNRWVDAAEVARPTAVEEALARLCGEAPAGG